MSARAGVSYQGTGYAVISTGWTVRSDGPAYVPLRFGRSRRLIAASQGVASASTITSSHEPPACGPRPRIGRVFAPKPYSGRRRFDGTPANPRARVAPAPSPRSFAGI